MSQRDSTPAAAVTDEGVPLTSSAHANDDI